VIRHVPEQHYESLYPCGGALHRKEPIMFTLFFVLIFFVLVIPLGITAQRWMFQEGDEVVDPKWELYQQHYD
jgi:hypothetical protein